MMKARILIAAMVFMALSVISSVTLQAQWATDGIPVCTFSRPQYSPSVITDARGAAIITWIDVRNAVIYWNYTAKLDVDGNHLFGWPDGWCVYCNFNSTRSIPVSDGSGGAIYSYSYYSTYPGNAVAERKDASGANQWETRLTLTNDTQGSVCSVSDGAGGAVCAWEDTRNGNYDIFAQRIDSGGSRAWAFGERGVIIHDDNQRIVTAVSDEAGGIIVIWTDYRNKNVSIYAQRLSHSGTTLWDSAGRPICTDASTPEGIKACPDGEHGAIITWYDDRNGNYDIFAQRISDSGDLQWVVNGLTVCAESGDQHFPEILDVTGKGVIGARNAIIAWRDERAGNADVYAQKINPLGVLDWTVTGQPICTNTDNQYLFGITTDESLGAIIAWYGQGIQAQRIDRHGSAYWAEDGIYVAHGYDGAIASDRDHGAIIAYVKTGSDSYSDIYAQRLLSDGTITMSHADLTSPTQNEMNVPTDTNIYVTFDMEMDETTLNGATIVVTGRSTGLHSGTFSYDSMTETMTFNPTVDFSNGELVSVVLTSGIESSSGTALKPYAWSFTTEANGGGGAFPTRSDYPAGNAPMAVIAADLDNDGDLDVVTSNLSDSIYVFPNNGDGTLATYTAYYAGVNPTSVCAVDIDLDGDLDLVTTNLNSNDISLFMNAGNGTFASATNRTATGNPTSVVPADVNADGYLDLVVANRGSDDISVFLNVGSPLWYDSPVKYPVAEYPYCVTTADFDNDGDLDVAVACFVADSLSVLMNLGDGTFDPYQSFYSGDGPHPLFSDDLDRDGYVDLIVGNFYDHEAAAFLNNGDGTFAPPSCYALYNNPSSIFTGDFDGDGDPDLAITIYLDPGFLSILANQGDGTFWNYAGELPMGRYPSSVFAADLDGDGDIDLAVSNGDSDNVSILLNATLTDAPELVELPIASALFQNHPNPFNPTTEIRYSLHRDAQVKLAVYNILGQHVITLVDEYQQAGYDLSVNWDARNQAGSRVASGIYFYLLQAGDFTGTRKMVLLK